MKKKWVAPRVEVQKFEANEYVAACWGVACDTRAANKWERNHWNGTSIHVFWDCGDADHQVLRDTDGNGRADVMIETKGDGLTCTIYPNDSFTPGTSISPEMIEPVYGNTIYWTTELNGRIYHHQGKINMEDPSRPNHS